MDQNWNVQNLSQQVLSPKLKESKLTCGIKKKKLHAGARRCH